MTALRSAPALPASAQPRLAGFTPNWFASVMGTGIVANAAVLLPVGVPARGAVALAAWLLAAGLLTVLLGAALAQVWFHPGVARSHHRSVTTAPFYGTVAMALLTVGSGALLAGRPLLGLHAAVVIDATLWSLGTAAGLLCALGVPYLMFTRHRLGLGDVSATWLLPVVPPVVAATVGAGLVAHLPAGQVRLSLELACATCFGIGVCLAAVLIVLLWARLALQGIGEARMVPSLWLVLGPLGSSVTASSLLAHDAHGPLLRSAALCFGLPVWGFSMLWLAFAAAVTLRTACAHLPFTLSWWAFTFPLGTVVTATSELALGTHAVALQWTAGALFVLLVGAWLTVAIRTVAGALSGVLFAPA